MKSQFRNEFRYLSVIIPNKIKFGQNKRSGRIISWDHPKIKGENFQWSLQNNILQKNFRLFKERLEDNFTCLRRVFGALFEVLFFNIKTKIIFSTFFFKRFCHRSEIQYFFTMRLFHMQDGETCEFRNFFFIAKN